MVRMTSSSSSSPVTHVLANSVMHPSSYNTHKTSPSSTDTACSQDDDDQPLELTSHTRQLAAASSATTSLSALTSTTSASQPQLTLAASTLRWTGHRYDICAPSNVLFSAYCDANVLMQTGTFNTSCTVYVQSTVRLS